MSREKEFTAREQEFKKMEKDVQKRFEDLYNYYTEQESRLATRRYLQSENKRLQRIIDNVKHILDSAE